jgi:hypothetical protein
MDGNGAPQSVNFVEVFLTRQRIFYYSSTKHSCFSFFDHQFDYEGGFGLYFGTWKFIVDLWYILLV